MYTYMLNLRPDGELNLIEKPPHSGWQAPAERNGARHLSDITEHKRAEAELHWLSAIVESSEDAIISERKQAEARLHLLGTALEATASAVAITDRKGVILWVNPAFSQLTGYSLQEAYGQKTSLLKSGAHDQAFYKNLWDTVCAGRVWRAEMTNRRKDGSLYTEENTITPVRDEQGEISCFIAVKQDITERKKSEEALRRSEAELYWKTAFLEAQVNSSLDGILVVNDEGKQILQNQRMLQLWKIPPNLANWSDDSKQLQSVMKQVKNPQAFVEKIEYLYAHRDEVSRDEIELLDGTTLDRYSSPVVGKDGSYYGRIWTFRDISEQRRLEAQYRQAQKLEGIGQLAGGVAHDFNNMLAVISGNAELMLLDTDQLGVEANRGLKDIIGAAERAATLTRQLLIFSRKQIMQSQPLVLNDVISNLVKMLQRIIPEDIRLDCAYEKESSYVQADAAMIEQVLLNLTVNARDAMPHGGLVRITTEKVSLNEEAVSGKPESTAGMFVCLSVSDTGSGIAPEHLPRIFDPFFTTKEPGKGTGLGLATVYGIVKQHHGWVEVSSQVGQGATFKVFLPAIAPPTEPAAAQQAGHKLRGGTETILLVEDDYHVRFITRRILETYGYKVCEAGSGRKALEVWNRQSEEIKLLLSDIVMPEGVTGRDLAEQLRARKPDLPVLFMSGYSAEVSGKETDFFRRTKSRFLQKPCTTRALVQMVRQCLDGK
jgi:two-component system, cell cycle sensor histidine kinase and response regulator CckA